MKDFITEQHQQDALTALAKMVSHPSYLAEAAPGAPFGQGVRDALDEMMTICDNLGFKTYTDPDGNYGYAEVGSGDDIFGIIGHVDVVPAGDPNDWATDPYKATIEDGVIHGRGTQDDKGPSVAALYAVKALMDAGVTFKERIRFIFGTDEENLWRGIAVYNEKEDPITHGIAPDAEFPVTYAEKGLQQAYLVGPGTDKLSLDLENPFNAVPAKAPYSGPLVDEVVDALDALGFDYEGDFDNGGIVVTGKAVHAMLAPEGTNAVLRLAMALDQLVPTKPLDFIGKLFKEDATGTNVLGDVEDDASGHLTFNISSLVINEKETRMQIDMRIPVTVDHDALIQKLSDRVADYDLKYEHFDYLAPSYVPMDSDLVQTLMSVYQDLTGDDTAPQVSGGATFARTMHNCVAFGAMLPDTPDYMHQVNEQWPIDAMAKAMQIYAEAIYRIAGK
ncbi:M20 family metallopeptidase [Secundilactobacillus kimchicus]|uniref:M20 family metallopeptidase n=1 Tax=Secundilactobacillus kimchicus TaxID=528209 RepID=UPI0024A88F0C|nr:M20 family metallopeptidase [Secundilactobacillus kimchicus]